MKLDKRYSQISPEAMEGSGQAKDLVAQANLKSGGLPGPLKVDESVDSAMLRPGVISWEEGHPVFDLKKSGAAGGIKAGEHLSLDRLLHSRYTQQPDRQGKEVPEFPDRGREQKAKAPAKSKAMVKAKAKAAEDFGHYFGNTEAEIAAAKKELAEAVTAAHAPNCTKGPAKNLPAQVCNPELAKRVVDARARLKALKGGGNALLWLGLGLGGAVAAYLLLK